MLASLAWSEGAHAQPRTRRRARPEATATPAETVVPTPQAGEDGAPTVTDGEDTQ